MYSRIALTVTLWIFAGCSQYSEPQGLSNTKDGPLTNTKQDIQNRKVGFDLVYERVFKKNCNSCHTGVNPPNLGSYENYRNQSQLIRDQVIVKRAMPPKYRLSDDDILLVEKWLNDGLLEVTKDVEKGPEKSGPPAEVDWTNLKKVFFTSQCITCHFNSNPDGISSYEDVEQVKATIGTIYYSSVISVTMPPAPKDYAGAIEKNPNQLSNEDKRLLNEWIIQGMR